VNSQPVGGSRSSRAAARSGLGGRASEGQSHPGPKATSRQCRSLEVRAVFGIIAGSIMLFYPLNDRLMVTIEEDLTARGGEAA
jgi:hypothetical protein